MGLPGLKLFHTCAFFYFSDLCLGNNRGIPLFHLSNTTPTTGADHCQTFAKFLKFLVCHGDNWGLFFVALPIVFCTFLSPGIELGLTTLTNVSCFFHTSQNSS
jgi:hypothetical protein